MGKKGSFLNEKRAKNKIGSSNKTARKQNNIH